MKRTVLYFRPKQREEASCY